jgi:FkbM family methyltransferase
MLNYSRKLRDLMTLPSQCRYLGWRLGLYSRNSINVKLLSGLNFNVRPLPTSDLDTAYEIFVSEVYKPSLAIDNQQIKKIVDLGSNVGYSVLYFSQLFPQATIDAFEPHPRHIAQLKHNIAANDLHQRVSVYEAAVSNHNGYMFLTDAETHSKIVEQQSDASLQVRVIDWLEIAQNQEIDILKIDIEGGEYPIIFDDRFSELNVKNLFIEWHFNPAIKLGQQDVYKRLKSMNYKLIDGLKGKVNELEFGIIWGSRN